MKKGIIAAGHSLTAEAGATLLKEGGNAFDAAIGAALTSFVSEFTMTSAGGGGFLMAHTGEKSVNYDFFVQTPSSRRPLKELNIYPVNLDFGGTKQEFYIGMGTCAVPGNLKGLFTVHRQLGRLPLPLVAEYAVKLAKRGFDIGPFHVRACKLLQEVLTATPEAKKLFTKDGQNFLEGDIVKMPHFADTLEYLAKNGEREFYEGEIAGKLVADCIHKGGELKKEDLKNYEVIARKPLHVPYRGLHLFTNPWPGTGGNLIKFGLDLLSGLEYSKYRFGSVAQIQIMAAVQALTRDIRDSIDFPNIRSQVELDSIWLDGKLHGLREELRNKADSWGSTTHISVSDKEGNAASITTTNGLGNGYVIPGTGIMTNNILGELDLMPAGLHSWQPDVRMPSMMAPSILLDANGGLQAVLGTGGSSRIRTALLQVITCLADYKMNIEEAVNAPRMHLENGILNIESSFPEESLSFIQDNKLFRKELWQDNSLYFGGVHGIAKQGKYPLKGAGDPRRAGVVLEV